MKINLDLKAVFMTGYNTPLEVRDVEKPGHLKNDEVLVKISMTGVCYRDILTVQGFFPKAKPPIILGHEIAGEVIEVGEGVKEFKKGDRVVSLTYISCGECPYCKKGQENICKNRLWFGEDIPGSYAEYVKTNIRSLVKVPTNVSDEAAAISACVTGMLLHAIRVSGGIEKGDTILVTGAGGGVGVHAIQIAKALGARVIALTSSKQKLERINELGLADEIVLAESKAHEEIKRLTSGDGVDLVIEAVGQPTFNLALRALKWGGRIAVIGNVTAASTELPLGLIILRENKIVGSISSTRRDVEEALRLTAEGKIRPVGKVFPLEEAQRAHDALKNREILGRAFLKP